MLQEPERHGAYTAHRTIKLYYTVAIGKDLASSLRLKRPSQGLMRQIH